MKVVLILLVVLIACIAWASAHGHGHGSGHGRHCSGTSCTSRTGSRRTLRRRASGCSGSGCRRSRERNQMLQTNRVVASGRGSSAFENKVQKEVYIVVRPRQRMNACDECKSVVQEIDSIIKDKTKLDEFKALLDMACDVAPSSFRAQCKELVQEIEDLAGEIEPFLSNPQEVCQTVGLCGQRRRHTRVMQFFMLYARKFVNQLNDSVQANDLLCDECIIAVNEVKQLVDDKEIQDYLKQQLDTMCSWMGDMKDECDSLVQQYFPALIQEIDTLLANPKVTCAELTLCSRRTRLVISGIPVTNARGQTHMNKLEQFRRMLSRLHTRNGMNVGCVMCKFGIGTLAKSVRDHPSIMNGITRTIQNTCNVLPQRGVRSGCMGFIRLYLKPMLILALEELSSRQICDEFQLCSEYELRQIRTNRLVGTWKNEVICEACKTLADFLKYECRQRSFQLALANEIKEICDVVPARFVTQCDNYVEQYVPYAVQMIVQELSPNVICPELHMCPAANEEVGDEEASTDSQSEDEEDDEDLQVLEE